MHSHIRDILTSVASSVTQIADNLIRIKADPDVTPKAIQEHDATCATLYDKLQQYASDPLTRPYMQCWSLVIKGKPDCDISATLTEEQHAALSTLMTANPEDFAARVGGLMVNIRKLLNEYNITPAEVSISRDEWKYVMPLTDADFDALTLAIRLKFPKAIESRLIVTSRSFTGWKFNAFHSLDDARTWVAQNT